MQMDERTAQVSARVSQIVLSLTQLALAGVILYRVYALGQKESSIADFQVILGLSLLANLFGSLYYGGYLPVLSVSAALKLYAAAVLILAFPLTIIYGFPQPSEWGSTLLPVLLGPAVMVGLYFGVARLGQKRLEKMIEE
jgi:hypothetical protein